MKINYLFSGVDKESGFNDKQSQYLKKDVKNNSKITFIASLFDDYERSDFHSAKILQCFEKIGINFKAYYVIDNRKTKEDMKDYINNSDVVYLMGGSPFLQMESIKKYDLVDILKNRSGITIGVSAGSMNQANSVIYKDDFMDNKILEYEGIGITDITIYPHLDFANNDYMEELFEVSKYREIVALPNESFIRIEDGKVNYIGDYYVVGNEKILKKEVKK